MYDIEKELVQQIAAAEDSFSSIFNSIETGTEHEGQDGHDALAERPLEATVTRRLTVLLTTGGPHVELVADLDSDGWLHNEYVVAYWGGERVQKRVERGSALYRALENYAAVAVVA